METTHIINHHYMTAHLLKEYCLCSSLLLFLLLFSSSFTLSSFTIFRISCTYVYLCITQKYERKNPILLLLNLLHLLMVLLLIFHSFHPISYLFIANILIGWLNIYGIFSVWLDHHRWSSDYMCSLQTMYRIISYYSVWGVPRIFIDTREKSRFKILNYELV